MKQVSEAKLQELNVLIDMGGSGTTSEVSDALADVQAAWAVGNMNEAKNAFDRAVRLNIQNAAVYGAMQQWHDSVAKGESTKPDDNPPTQGGGVPVAPLAVTPVDGKTYQFGPVLPETSYSTVAGGDGRFSCSTDSGSFWVEVLVNGKLAANGSGTSGYADVQKDDEIQMRMGKDMPGQAKLNYTLSFPAARLTPA